MVTRPSGWRAKRGEEKVPLFKQLLNQLSENGERTLPVDRDDR